MCKVSVIVPIYKAQEYLEPCIQSLLRQTLQSIEIILVDDGSPDGCGKICDDYQQKDARITVLHKRNEGVSRARNDGLSLAVGEWVIFCDSDDWLEEDALQTMVAEGERSHSDVVFADIYKVEGDKKEVNTFYRQSFANDDKDTLDQLVKACFSRKYCFDPPPNGPAYFYGGPWNKLVRRELLLAHNIRFDENLGGIYDDVLYSVYIFSAAARVSYVQKPVYNYRQLGNSITHTYKANVLEINDAIFRAFANFMAIYGTDGCYQKPFYALVVRRFKATLGLYFFNKKHPEKLPRQLHELRVVLNKTPYKEASAGADRDKLQNNFDLWICRAMRIRSPLGVYLLYRAFIFREKRRRIDIKQGNGS